MKPLPKAPPVPGKTESERFDNAVRHVLTVSKDELLKREAQERSRKERKSKAPKAWPAERFRALPPLDTI
jgi:hypothetical protein